jgi:hypothetical protein
MHPVRNLQSPTKSGSTTTMMADYCARCPSGGAPAQYAQFDGMGVDPNMQGVRSDLPADPVRAGHGQQGEMSALLRLLGVTESEAALGADIPTTVRRLHVGDTLFHEGAPAEAIYSIANCGF